MVYRDALIREPMRWDREPMIVKTPRLFGTISLCLVVGLIGCRHIGPGVIVEDRLPYNDAIATSWKQQTLLNIVRMRYMDVTEFVDVSSIVGGYGLDRTATGTITSAINPLPPGSTAFFGLVGSRTLSDRPTISFAPQTGSAFTRNLVNPLSPTSILTLIESGNPADLVLDLAVDSINGIRNQQVFDGKFQEADPEFSTVAQILKKAQASGEVSLRLVMAKDRHDPDMVMTIQDRNIDPALAAELAQLRKILRLDPSVREFKIVVGTLPQAKDEIAFRTRSVIRIIMYLSTNVQVPESHLAAGPAPDLGITAPRPDAQMTVYSGCKAPCDAYAAVCYQGFWFWIDPRDFKSKRTMSYLKILLALADTGLKEPSPVLTIRAN